MRALDLGQALRKTGLAPLYLVMGEEDYLRDRAMAAITSMAAESGGDSGGGLEAFNYDLFYGDEDEAAEILTSARTVSVFAPRRVVLVKATDKLPAREADALLPYLNAPIPSTTLVFVAAKLDGRLKFAQALKDRAVLVDCSPLPSSQVGDWVREEANRLGLRLTEDAVDPLKELAGESLSFVRRELEKLAAYVQAGRVAGPDDVEAVRGGEPGASVFNLTAAIGRRETGRALRILARNIESGEAPLRILGSLVWQYRQIWKAKEQLNRGTAASSLSRSLRVPPFRLREFLGQFPEAHLAKAFRLFLEADSDLKGGSAAPPARILEALLLALCMDSRGSGSGPPASSPAKTKTIRTVQTVRTGKTAPR